MASLLSNRSTCLTPWLAQLAHRRGETLTNRMNRQQGAGEHPQRRIGQRQHPLRVQVALIQLRDKFADVVASQHRHVGHRPSPNWFEGGIVIPILRIDNFNRLRPRSIGPDCLQPGAGRHCPNRSKHSAVSKQIIYSIDYTSFIKLNMKGSLSPFGIRRSRRLRRLTRPRHAPRSIAQS